MSRFVIYRDFQRVKRRLEKMSEHLRDSLQTTTSELWVAIDEEVYERKQAPPLFQMLLDERTQLISQAVRTGIDGLRDELLSLIEPVVTPPPEPVAQLTEGWQKWDESVESQLEEAKRKHDALEATVFQVAGSAQEASVHLN